MGGKEKVGTEAKAKGGLKMVGKDLDTKVYATIAERRDTKQLNVTTHGKHTT